MTFFECHADETLLRQLGFSQKELKGGHSFGRSRVAGRISKSKDSFGLVDEDPGSARDPYLEKLFKQKPAFVDRDLIVLIDKKSNNKIVVIRPNLETLMIKVAKDSKLNLEAKPYSLSMRPEKLHDHLTPESNVGQRKKLSEFIDVASKHGAISNLKKFLRN